MKLLADVTVERPADIARVAAVVPIVAASADAVAGLCLGLATLSVLGAVDLLAKPLPTATQAPPRRANLFVIAAVIVTIGASLGLVACFEFFLGATSAALFLSMGAVLPLLASAVLPCFAAAIVEPAESLQPGKTFPVFNSVQAAMLVFAAGCLRELLGHGTLFRNAELLFGSWLHSGVQSLGRIDAQDAGAASHLNSSEWSLFFSTPAAGFLVAATLVALIGTLRKSK